MYRLHYALIIKISFNALGSIPAIRFCAIYLCLTACRGIDPNAIGVGVDVPDVGADVGTEAGAEVEGSDSDSGSESDDGPA